MSEHRDAFTEEQFVANVKCFLKSLYIVEPFYACCMPAVKISILLLYWRLFKTIHWMRTALYITAAMVIMWMLGAQAAGIFQCWPIEKFWDPLTPGHCINGRVYFIAITTTNLLTDAITLCLPIPIVWNLQASMRQRISLIIGFLIGGFVSLITIIRIEYLNNPHDPDPLYSATKGPIWTAAETSLAVVCANLPVIYVLFRRPLSRVVSTFTDAGTGSARRRPAHLAYREYELGTRSKASAVMQCNQNSSRKQSGIVILEDTEDHVSENSDLAILSPNNIYVRTDYEVDIQQDTYAPIQRFHAGPGTDSWS